MSNRRIKKKYYFPKLDRAIKIEFSWTNEEFKQNAIEVNKKPSRKGWENLMNVNIGMTLAYTMKGQKILSTLGFSPGACEYIPTKRDK